MAWLFVFISASEIYLFPTWMLQFVYAVIHLFDLSWRQQNPIIFMHPLIDFKQRKWISLLEKIYQEFHFRVVGRNQSAFCDEFKKKSNKVRQLQCSVPSWYCYWSSPFIVHHHSQYGTITSDLLHDSSTFIPLSSIAASQLKYHRTLKACKSHIHRGVWPSALLANKTIKYHIKPLWSVVSKNKQEVLIHRINKGLQAVDQ